jgi:hypothetical protein
MWRGASSLVKNKEDFMIEQKIEEWKAEAE